jgi:hypothetical protein
VVGATSGLPFTTLDTVGNDTPASAAIAARVVFRTATPFDLSSKFIEILNARWNSAVLAASYGNQSNMKTFVTTRKRRVDRHRRRTYDGGTSKVFENFRKCLASTPGDESCVAAGRMPPLPRSVFG